MKRRIIIIGSCVVALGFAALAFAYVQGAGPFTKAPVQETAVLGGWAPQACVQGAGGCALADGGKGCGGCPAMPAAASASKGCCPGRQASAPNPACCPDGCPSIKDGKCPNIGACVCPGGAKGGTCAGKTVQTTCGGMKSGGCAMAAGTQMAGCPARQADASKQASCQASCPFSTK